MWMLVAKQNQCAVFLSIYRIAFFPNGHSCCALGTKSILDKRRSRTLPPNRRDRPSPSYTILPTAPSPACTRSPLLPAHRPAGLNTHPQYGNIRASIGILIALAPWRARVCTVCGRPPSLTAATLPIWAPLPGVFPYGTVAARTCELGAVRYCAPGPAVYSRGYWGEPGWGRSGKAGVGENAECRMLRAGNERVWKGRGGSRCVLLGIRGNTMRGLLWLRFGNMATCSFPLDHVAVLCLVCSCRGLMSPIVASFPNLVPVRLAVRCMTM